MREPNKTVSKQLYLVFVKNLVVVDRNSYNVPLPMRPLAYYKDTLTRHFTQLIRAHADLKMKERNHTDVCSCDIQIDLSPEVKPFLQGIYHRLVGNEPAKHYRVTKLEPKMMATFEYLLGITQ